MVVSDNDIMEGLKNTEHLLVAMLSEPSAVFSAANGELLAGNTMWATEHGKLNANQVFGVVPEMEACFTIACSGKTTDYEGASSGTTRRRYRFSAAVDGRVLVTMTTFDDAAFLAVNQSRMIAESIGIINAALAAATDEDDILKAVADFVEQFGVGRSALLYAVRDENQDADTFDAVEMVALRGHGNKLPLDTLPVKRFEVKDFPLVAFIQEKPTEVVFIENAETDPQFADTVAGQFMRKVKDYAAILVPLKVSDQWQAVLTFSFQQPQYFSPEVRRVFAEIRPIIASVVATRRLNLELAEKLRLLTINDKLKDEFLANMSHELRTPLNAIIGTTDLMLSGYGDPLPNQTKTDIERIYSSAEHLLHVVNDVLDLSKIESGVFELAKDETDLVAIADEVERIVKVNASDQGVKLVNNLTGRQLPLIEADGSRIRQVLMNLLSNAIKFSHKGKGAVTLDGKFDEEKKQVILWVADEGIGIPDEYHNVIFQRFRQVEGKLSRRRGGAGLGLPISKTLVELHGGQLWLESTMGQGSTFYLSIPT